jgi:hypothetical protein
MVVTGGTLLVGGIVLAVALFRMLLTAKKR